MKGRSTAIRHVEIVFCSMHDTTTRLDCVATEGDNRGWPFTVVATIPDGPEWAQLAARQLAVWTADATAVELRVESGARSTVRIGDDAHALRLDLVGILDD